MVGILNSLRLTGSTASCKKKKIIVFVSLLSPVSQNPPFSGGHLCTFVSCNCVNVPVS